MKKRRKGRKFNRETDQRKAFMKALSRALLLKEKIRTTDARAKELSSFVQRQITKAKKGSLSSFFELSRLFSPDVVKKLKELGKRYKQRKGGYTRIYKLQVRKRDNAKMAVIELLK